MRIIHTPRGFQVLAHPTYPHGNEERLIQESSAVGDYEDSLENPGSSYLWVGDYHHLNREDVKRMIHVMEHWLETGRLAKAEKPEPTGISKQLKELGFKPKPRHLQGHPSPSVPLPGAEKPEPGLTTVDKED